MQTMQVSGKGIQFICSFESFSPKPYPDPGTKAEPITTGFGTTVYPDTGKKVTLQDAPITKARALDYVQMHISRNITPWVNQHFTGLAQCQFDAVVSFVYNVGLGNLEHSHLLAAIDHHLNCGTITADFAMWDKSAGRVLGGLERRRNAEAAMYCNCTY
jgi:lysozyme